VSPERLIQTFKRVRFKDHSRMTYAGHRYRGNTSFERDDNLVILYILSNQLCANIQSDSQKHTVCVSGKFKSKRTTDVSD